MCLMGYNQEVASENKSLVFHTSAKNWAAVVAAEGELQMIAARKLAARAPQPEVPANPAPQAAANTGLQQPMSVAFKVGECVNVNWEGIQRGGAASAWHSGVVEKVQCRYSLYVLPDCVLRDPIYMLPYYILRDPVHTARLCVA